MNLKYCVDYETSESNANCDCEGMCRCSKISGVRIRSVLIPSLAGKFALKSKIDRYLVDRLLRIYKAYDVSIYDVSIEITNSDGSEVVFPTWVWPAAKKGPKYIVTKGRNIKGGLRVSAQTKGNFILIPIYQNWM